MKTANKALLVISLIIILFLASGVYSSSDKSAKVSSKVYSEIQNKPVEVVIKLKDAGKGVSEMQKQPKDYVDDVIGQNKTRYVFDNSIVSATIDQNDLENLKNSNQIESIEVVPIRHLFLQDSVGIINA